MAALVILLIIAQQRNANNPQAANTGRPQLFRNVGNRGPAERRVFRTRNTNADRGFGSRFRRF